MSKQAAEKSRLLLLSSSRTHGTQYLEHGHDWLADFLGDIKSVLFIPYASVTKSWDDYTALVADTFARWNVDVTGLHAQADPRNAVSKAQAIVVGGGNTFMLLKQLYQHDLLATIRARVQNSTPYIGWSAGTNIACPSIRTSNDMPIVEPPSFTALGLVPFQINPYYVQGMPPGHMGETRDQRLEEFLTADPAAAVLALPEGSALQCSSGPVQLLGKPASLFRNGNVQPATENLLADLWYK